MKGYVIRALLAVGLTSLTASASLTVDYGWEDGFTCVRLVGTAIAENVTSPVYEGTHSLLVDRGTGTPDDVWLALITDINQGDQVSASIRAKGELYKLCCWYLDSAGEKIGEAYRSPGYSGNWNLMSFTLNFDSTRGAGLAVVAELHNYEGIGYVDAMRIVAPDYATITLPTPEPATVGLLGAGGLALLRRRRG